MEEGVEEASERGEVDGVDATTLPPWDLGPDIDGVGSPSPTLSVDDVDDRDADEEAPEAWEPAPEAAAEVDDADGAAACDSCAAFSTEAFESPTRPLGFRWFRRARKRRSCFSSSPCTPDISWSFSCVRWQGWKTRFPTEESPANFFVIRIGSLIGGERETERGKEGKKERKKERKKECKKECKRLW